MDVETWQTRNNKIDLRISKTEREEVRVRRRKEQNSGVGMKMV
jgi:hypothetical protein